MYFTSGAQLAAALKALPASKLGNFSPFDDFFYGQTYMAGYQGALSPIDHFVTIGAARGFKPNELLDPGYYANAYADLRGKGLDGADLLYHFMMFGLDEGRVPNESLAGFNGADYLAANTDVKAYVTANLKQFGGSESNGALAHYLKFGVFEGRSTSLSGQTFTLTAGVDEATGTAVNDTFNAPVGSVGSGTAASTLGALDKVDGGAGRDTLNMTVTAEANTKLVGSVKNIEVVNVTGANYVNGTAAANAALAAAQAAVATAQGNIASGEAVIDAMELIDPEDYGSVDGSTNEVWSTVVTTSGTVQSGALVTINVTGVTVTFNTAENYNNNTSDERALTLAIVNALNGNPAFAGAGYSAYAGVENSAPDNNTLYIENDEGEFTLISITCDDADADFSTPDNESDYSTGSSGVGNAEYLAALVGAAVGAVSTDGSAADSVVSQAVVDAAGQAGATAATIYGAAVLALQQYFDGLAAAQAALVAAQAAIGSNAMDASFFGGAEQIWLVGSESNLGTVSNVTTQIVGLRGMTSADALVQYAAATTAGTIALDGAKGELTLSGSKLATANLATSGTNDIALQGGIAVTTVNVSGAGTNTLSLKLIDSVAPSVAVNASTATGALTLNMGTQLSSGDTLTGGTASDKLVAEINGVSSINPTMTGIETADLKFTAAGTLNLSKTANLATINLTPVADATISNADASLKTVNVTAATDFYDVNVGYRSGVDGALTLNIGGTANVFLDELDLTHVTDLSLKFSGKKFNYFNDLSLIGASATKLSIDVAAETDAYGEDMYASGLTALTMNIGDNADGEFNIYASGNVGDVNLTASLLSDGDLYLNASGSVGNVNVVARDGADWDYVDIDASGNVGNVRVDSTGGDSSTEIYIDAYSGGSVGNIVLNGANPEGDVDGYFRAFSRLNAAGDVVGGNIGNISLTLTGGLASGDVDASAYGGSIGNVTFIADGGSASGDIYLASYASGNSAGDAAAGGTIGNIVIEARGASADAEVSAYAYGDLDSGGDYLGGGNIGNVSIYVSGGSAEGEAVLYAYSGGSIGTIAMVVEGGDTYSASAYVSAFAEGSGGQIGEIGDVSLTINGGVNNSGDIYLQAYSGANVGNITGNILGGISGQTSIYITAYDDSNDDSDGDGGNVGRVNIVDASFEGDHYLSAYVDGVMDNVTYSVGGGSANVRMELNGSGDFGNISLTFAANHAESAGYLNLNTEGDVGQITLTGGSTASYFNIGAYGDDVSAGSVTGVNAANWNGSVEINLAGVQLGTSIYASKDGSYIVGTEGTDAIYLGAKGDRVELDGSPTAVDTIYSFTSGTGGDSLDLIASATTLKSVMSTNTAATVADGDILRLSDIAGGQDITTAAGLKAALNGGEFASLAATADTSATIVTASSTSATTFYVFNVTNDGADTATDFDTVTLVGIVQSSGALSALVADNFA